MKPAKIIAVLGTGNAGTRHIHILKQIRNIEVIAVPMRANKRDILEKEGLRVARNLEEAVGLGATFCVVATDSKEHAGNILAAQSYNLAVLSEKPLCTRLAEASELFKKCKDTKKVFVGCVLRFSDSLQYFKSHLETIGPFYSVRIECQSYLPDWRPNRNYRESYSARKGEGGALLDLIHEIDYAGWMFGWPKFIDARIKNFGILNIESEEMAELRWETEKGVFVSICLDYLSRISRRRIRAYGEKGILEWEGIGGSVCLRMPGQASQTTKFSQTKEEMFLKQAEAFLNFEGTSMEEGMKALAICDAARLSSEARREQTIQYFL